MSQQLLAVVDEGDLAAVTKLLDNPDVSVNVTNKVSEEGERGRGGGGEERELFRQRKKRGTTDASLYIHSMGRVPYTSLLDMVASTLSNC